MKLPSRTLVAIFLLNLGIANAQSLAQTSVEAGVRLEATGRELREAMVRFRDVHAQSCKFGQLKDCEVVSLTDMQIALLDIEGKYQRAARSGSAASTIEKAKRISTAAAEARGMVSELADAIKREAP